MATYFAQHAPLLRGVVVGALFIIPVFAHAGVFSALLSLTTEVAADEVSATLESPQNVPLLKAVTNTDPHAARGGGDVLVDEDGFLISTLGPDATLGTADQGANAGEIQTYTVQESESLSVIADKFGVSVNTILWANDIKNPNTIRPGDTLVILPVSGVRHVVKNGDTVKAIATKYHSDVDDIIAYNSLVNGADLIAGTTIVIPGGEVVMPVVAKKKIASTKAVAGSKGVNTAGYFTNPVPGAVHTQGIHGYNGVDLGAPVGTPIRAAADGDVILARMGGYNGGYGNYIVIKHPNGTQTLYAHMSSMNVNLGERVSQGDVVGGVGSTGRSTGAHLHFEVRGGKNPF